jgi:hypothetical protein
VTLPSEVLRSIALSGRVTLGQASDLLKIVEMVEGIEQIPDKLPPSPFLGDSFIQGYDEGYSDAILQVKVKLGLKEEASEPCRTCGGKGWIGSRRDIITGEPDTRRDCPACSERPKERA